MKNAKQTIEAVPAAEFTRNFGVYRVRAERKAVAVSSHGRVTGYFVAADEYERLIEEKQPIEKSFEDALKAGPFELGAAVFGKHSSGEHDLSVRRKAVVTEKLRAKHRH